MQKCNLGNSDLGVSAIRLGGMGVIYGYPLAEVKQEMISLLRSPVVCRVTFFDTNEVYGLYTNEIRGILI